MLKFRWFMWQLAWRFKVTCWFNKNLKQLLANKQLIIKMIINDESRYLGFEDGNILLLKELSTPATLELTYSSVELATSIIYSAIKGDNFWLKAIRDRRVSVNGDMGILLWFFGLCRHLPGTGKKAVNLS